MIKKIGSKTNLGKMKMDTQHSKIYGYKKDSSKREVYSNTGLPQEKRKISNKQPKIELEKEQTIDIFLEKISFFSS